MDTGATATRANDSAMGEIATAAKHSFVYGFGSMLAKSVGFLLLPLYTHYLSPSDYGVFEVIELGMSLLGMFLSLGITAAILRYHGMAETDAQRRTVISTMFVVSVAISGGAFLAGFPLIRPATTMLLGPGVPAAYLLMSFVGFLIAYIAQVPYTALRAKEASGTVTAIDTVSTIVLLLLNVYLIAVLKTSLFGMFLGRIIVNCLTLIVLVRLTRRDLVAGIDWHTLRQTIAFGAPLILMNITMFALNFSDRFFLQRLQSLEAVGIYAVGYKFGYVLSFVVIWPFNMMLHARMYIIHRRPDHGQIFARILSLYSALLVLAGLAISIFSREIIRFMADARYAEGESVVAIISMAYVLFGIGGYFQTGLYLTSRTGLIGVVSAAAAIINLAANYLLIPKLSMLGAAWATVLGFLVIAVGSYYAGQRVCSLPYPVGRVGRTLAVAVATYMASRAFPTAPLALVLLWKSLLVVMFPALLRISGCFSRDELETLESLRAGAVRMTLRFLKPASVRI